MLYTGHSYGLIVEWDLRTGASMRRAVEEEDEADTPGYSGTGSCAADAESGPGSSWGDGDGGGGGGGRTSNNVWIKSIAVQGRLLLTGVALGADTAEGGAVGVWSLDHLTRLRRVCVAEPVKALLALDGEVWAGVGADLLRWGPGPSLPDAATALFIAPPQPPLPHHPPQHGRHDGPQGLRNSF